jgi:NADH:ubiquinone oxidoreductase subunit E
MENPEPAVPVPTPPGRGIAGKIFGQIQASIDETKGQTGALIPVLQQAQGLIGYLPMPVLRSIARDMRVSLSEVYGIASFYSFFTIGNHRFNYIWR